MRVLGVVATLFSDDGFTGATGFVGSAGLAGTAGLTGSAGFGVATGFVPRAATAALNAF